MIRGTTPTLEFTLPFNCDDIDILNIAFAQAGEIVLEKSLSDVTINDKEITLQLTEADTLSFNSDIRAVEIQLRIGSGAKRLASQIVKTSVWAILKDGALE